MSEKPTSAFRLAITLHFAGGMRHGGMFAAKLRKAAYVLCAISPRLSAKAMFRTAFHTVLASKSTG